MADFKGLKMALLHPFVDGDPKRHLATFYKSKNATIFSVKDYLIW